MAGPSHGYAPSSWSGLCSSSGLWAARRPTVLGLQDGQPVDEAGFRQRLEKSGIALHGAGNLFCFTDEARKALLGEPDDPSLRLLTEADARPSRSSRKRRPRRAPPRRPCRPASASRPARIFWVLIVMFI